MSDRSAVGAAVLGLILTFGAVTTIGCSSSSHENAGVDHSSLQEEVVPADAPFNAADLTFVRAMLPHHEQAVTMADSAIATSAYIDLLEFATTIRATQSSEIEQMRSWLTTWGQPEADPAMSDSMSDSMDMPGMDGASFDADMTRLGARKSLEYALLWLDLMIEHHRGALDMARTEVGSGRNPEVIALAQAILSTQQGEIDAMAATKLVLR